MSELERLKSELKLLKQVAMDHDTIVSAINATALEIARIEAEAEDPWREAKEFCNDYRGDKERFGIVTAYIDHLTAENDRLAKRVAELERHVATLVQAGNLYRQASFQSHSGHWDSTMQYGKGCPECIRANDLRKQADEMMDQEECPEAIESIEPVLDPDRVLATARKWFVDTDFGRHNRETIAEVIQIIGIQLNSRNAKPYRLKGAGDE